MLEITKLQFVTLYPPLGGSFKHEEEGKSSILYSVQFVLNIR